MKGAGTYFYLIYIFSEQLLLAGIVSWFAKIGCQLSVENQTVNYWYPMTAVGRNRTPRNLKI
jgi:hypothetical protein